MHEAAHQSLGRFRPDPLQAPGYFERTSYRYSNEQKKELVRASLNRLRLTWHIERTKNFRAEGNWVISSGRMRASRRVQCSLQSHRRQLNGAAMSNDAKSADAIQLFSTAAASALTLPYRLIHIIICMISDFDGPLQIDVASATPPLSLCGHRTHDDRTAYAHSLADDHNLERIEVDFGSFRPAEDVRDILVSSDYILVARQSIYSPLRR